MKKLLIPFISLFLSSCSIMNYYQVYKAVPQGGSVGENFILFEDTNCSVSYNLWAKGGDIGFIIYNKTDKDISIDLVKTFFVINGRSFQYFKNRTFITDKSTTKEITVGDNIWTKKVSITTTETTSTTEMPTLIIPGKTRISIINFDIVSDRFVSCDMSRYPAKKENKSLEFSSANSPFEFSNLITYNTPNETIRMENKFYVSEITNFHEKDVMRQVDKNICGGKLETPIKMLMSGAPGMFYIIYQ